MKHLIYIYSALMLVLVSSCNYLDIVPEDDIQNIDSIFEQRTSAETWFLGCYALAARYGSSAGSASSGTDELSFTIYPEQVHLGKIISQGQLIAEDPAVSPWTGGAYTVISYCNTFIEKIDNVYSMEPAEKELWKGEIIALKAEMYFELMRHYGSIVLIDKNIASNLDIEDMQTARAPFEECIAEVVSLCDEAALILPAIDQKSASRVVYHSRTSALYLKAKALLLSASPQFNGNPAYVNLKNEDGVLMYSQDVDKEKWKVAAEAADVAIQEANIANVKLLNNTSEENTPLLNKISDIQNSVIASNYKNCEGILFNCSYGGKGWTFNVCPFLPASDDNSTVIYKPNMTPTVNMVEMYYTKNGLPIDMDNSWFMGGEMYKLSREENTSYTGVVPIGTNILNLHLRREPRFYAHIAADRCYWQRGNGSQYNILVEARQGEYYGSANSVIDARDVQNLTGYFLKKHTSSDLTFKDLMEINVVPTPVYRLAELYLMSSEAWNEYEGPTARALVGINIVRERAGIPDVASSWGGSFSKNTTKHTTTEGMRDIIHNEWNVEFAFEGRRFWNLRRWLTADKYLNNNIKGWVITSSTEDGFYNNGNGPVDVDVLRVFRADRDYLFPIRSEEILISGTVQNPNW